MASSNYRPQTSSYSPANNLNFYSSSSYSSMPYQSYESQANAYSTAPGVGVTGQMGTMDNSLRTGWLAAFGTEGYPGEPPLLEELGVSFEHIQTKTLAVLNPIAKIDHHLMDDSDLAGPLLFCALFGASLLLTGRLWLGYVSGLAVVGAVVLNGVFGLMAPEASRSSSPDHHVGLTQSNLSIGRSSSVLGYCLLPLVLVSVVGILLPLNSFIGYCLVSLAITWCTYSSSAMFCAVGRMTEMRGLVAYPLALFYTGFGIMTIFSSSS